ncbi:MAG: type IVB secretion system protein IcmJDotN [Alphaproteobacteria bacterium]|nr:type IVB secretion system protein IcmJDotN [Alphaproteobacteria bacterium]
MIPITIGIAQKSSAFLSDKNSDQYASLKSKVLERDDYTCQCCGFKSQKYQDILLIDQSAPPKENNLATACIFCHQCFYLDDVAEMRSGILLWLPEISQADLHHIARALYVARISQGPMSETARKILDTLMMRRADVRERIGTDEPTVLTNVLRDYVSRKKYAERGKRLDGVRLFPLDRRIIKEQDLEFNQFPQILAYWRSKEGPFSGKIPNNWIDLYKNLEHNSG